MKNLRIALLSLALLAPVALTSAAVAQTAPTAQKDPLLARIKLKSGKEKEIHFSDFVRIVQSMPEIRTLGPEGMQAIVPLLINQALVEDAAAQANISSSDPRFKKMMETAEKEARIRIYIQNLMDAQITEDKMRARFDALMKDFKKQEEVDLYHILVANEGEAKAVIKELDKGAKFEDLAAAKSLDKASSERGGSIGYIVKDMLDPETGAAVFKLRSGKYAKSPVKTSSGWEIFYVKDRRQQPKPTFEKAKNEVRALMAQELIVQVEEQLREQHKDRIFLCNPESNECVTLAEMMSKAKAQQTSGEGAGA